MSYRALKRLLGESSLERKCQLLLGGGIFILIMISFFLYWYQTEKLVWEKTRQTAESLVYPVLLKRHAQQFRGAASGESIELALVRAGVQFLARRLDGEERKHTSAEADAASNPAQLPAPPAPAENSRRALAELSQFLFGSPWFSQALLSNEDVEDLLPENVRTYESRILRPGVDRIEYRHRSPWERSAFEQIQAGDGKLDAVSEINKKQHLFRYMGAIRMRDGCLKCHPTALDRELGFDKKEVDSLHSAVSLTLPLADTEFALNLNRAILLSFAVFTAFVAMIFAYFFVRYVIVKPVAHLKEVSDEIAAGNVDIRSNIHTGDEFQELSIAFNRMIRSLVSMQEQLRKVNSDLDNKLDELAQANMALFEMNRLKSEFLTTISHELRTPLNSIIGFSELLGEINALDGKQQRWVQNIQSSGQALLTMINDVLDLAKLEAGKMQVHVEPFSLRDLVEEQVALARPIADKKNLALSTDIDASIPILNQDFGKLQQILSNLLSNAIKFTPEGGRIVVSCRTDRARFVLSVADNGVGIAAEDQQLIFEKFRQAERGLTRGHGGTGLGLSIVRELTKLLGGDDVELESELGRGSTFTIRLPIHLDPRRPSDLTLGDEAGDITKDQQNEVRFYTSRDRAVGAETHS